jgi:hypothetical protein
MVQSLSSEISSVLCVLPSSHGIYSRPCKRLRNQTASTSTAKTWLQSPQSSRSTSTGSSSSSHQTFSSSGLGSSRDRVITEELPCSFSFLGCAVRFRRRDYKDWMSHHQSHLTKRGRVDFPSDTSHLLCGESMKTTQNDPAGAPFVICTLFAIVRIR